MDRLAKYFGEPIASDPFRTDWMLPLVILPVIIYIIASVFERFPLARVTKTVFRYTYAVNSYRDNSGGHPIYSRLMGIIAILSITTFLYFTESIYSLGLFGLSGFSLWSVTLALVSGAILLRYIATWLTGSITGSRELFGEYFFYITNFYMFLSIPLMVINFLVPYMVALPDKVLIICGLVFGFLIILLRYIRLTMIFMRRSFSLFYLILYLCALEITPVLIFLKYLSGTV